MRSFSSRILCVFSSARTPPGQSVQKIAAASGSYSCEEHVLNQLFYYSLKCPGVFKHAHSKTKKRTDGWRHFISIQTLRTQGNNASGSLQELVAFSPATEAKGSWMERVRGGRSCNTVRGPSGSHTGEQRKLMLQQVYCL